MSCPDCPDCTTINDSQVKIRGNWANHVKLHPCDVFQLSSNEFPNFYSNVARGTISGFYAQDKFGRTNVVNIATPKPLTIWSGGGEYTGQPIGISEPLEIFSSDNADTQTIRVTGLDDSGLEIGENIVLNGTTPVIGASLFSRAPRAEIISGVINAGDITIRHSITIANVMSLILAGRGRTLIGAFTIPFNKTGEILSLSFAMVRENGSAGSATVTLRVRRQGELSYNNVRNYEISSGQDATPPMKLPILLGSGDDVLAEVEDVSDNGTVVTFETEYILRDL